MKKLVLCLTIVLTTFCGCSQKNNSITQANPIQQDLKQYTESLTSIKEEETSALNQYATLCTEAANMKRDEVVEVFDNEILPAYNTFYNNLQNVSVSTDEVSAIKDSYVSGVDLQLKGMTAMSEAIKNNDKTVAEEANQMIEQGKMKIAQHRTEIIDLANVQEIAVK